MKIGICTTVDYSTALKNAGFDYIESALVPVSSMAGEELEKYAAASAVPTPVFNNFFDRNAHKLVGENIDFPLLEQYIRTALHNAAKLGCKVVVLGSGYSRRVPDGYDRTKALDQFAQDVTLAANIAKEFGITVAVEPLNYRETNLLNTFAETADFARRIGLDNVRVTADFFHIVQNDEGWDGLYDNADLLGHVHICHPQTRAIPKVGDGFDYIEFKTILNRIGYNGLVSVEGISQNWEQDIPDCAKALECFR